MHFCGAQERHGKIKRVFNYAHKGLSEETCTNMKASVKWWKGKIISNSNWTEWSTIQGVIAWVISKSDEREAQGRFEITGTITSWIVRHEVQSLINGIYNKFRN